MFLDISTINAVVDDKEDDDNKIPYLSFSLVKLLGLMSQSSRSMILKTSKYLVELLLGEPDIVFRLVSRSWLIAQLIPRLGEDF